MLFCIPSDLPPLYNPAKTLSDFFPLNNPVTCTLRLPSIGLHSHLQPQVSLLKACASNNVVLTQCPIMDMQGVQRRKRRYVLQGNSLLPPGPAPSSAPDLPFPMLSLSCGPLPLGSLKVCGVLVCVSGALGSMVPSLTPLYSCHLHTIPMSQSHPHHAGPAPDLKGSNS